MKLKTICFDIDNIICKTNSSGDYSKSVPIRKNIKVINDAYESGFNIILYTARYMGRCKGNLTKVKTIITIANRAPSPRWVMYLKKVSAIGECHSFTSKCEEPFP